MHIKVAKARIRLLTSTHSSSCLLSRHSNLESRREDSDLRCVGLLRLILQRVYWGFDSARQASLSRGGLGFTGASALLQLQAFDLAMVFYVRLFSLLDPALNRISKLSSCPVVQEAMEQCPGTRIHWNDIKELDEHGCLSTALLALCHQTYVRYSRYGRSSCDHWHWRSKLQQRSGSFLPQWCERSALHLDGPRGEEHHVCGLDVTGTRDRDTERATRLWQPRATWPEMLLEASAQERTHADQLVRSC